jgi:hypothetical protein
MSDTLIPSSGMFTECVSEASKSMSSTVDPPLPSVKVILGEPEAVLI